MNRNKLTYVAVVGVGIVMTLFSPVGTRLYLKLL
jgi:hypothetical protein